MEVCVRWRKGDPGSESFSRKNKLDLLPPARRLTHNPPGSSSVAFQNSGDGEGASVSALTWTLLSWGVASWSSVGAGGGSFVGGPEAGGPSGVSGPPHTWMMRPFNQSGSDSLPMNGSRTLQVMSSATTKRPVWLSRWGGGTRTWSSRSTTALV